MIFESGAFNCQLYLTSKLLPLHRRLGSRLVELRATKFPKTPYFGNLATARCVGGQVSESATAWQIFPKIEYAAGMPQDILSTGREQPRRSDPQALQWISPQLPCASHLPSVGPVYGGTDGLIFGALSHEQIGKNEGICHHKMATKQDSTG